MMKISSTFHCYFSNTVVETYNCYICCFVKSNALPTWGVCMCLVIQFCLILCNPLDCSLPGCSWVFQARILEWVAISSFRASSWPRDQNFILLKAESSPAELSGKSIGIHLIESTTVCERQILPQISYAIVGRKYTCACTKLNTWDRICHVAGKGENSASTPEVSGTVYQRSPWAMTERREQHKGADGKAVCMYRKQSVIPQKHEKVSKDVKGKEAPNLDLYFLAVWSLASCTTSLSLSFLLFKNELPKKNKNELPISVHWKCDRACEVPVMVTSSI